MPGTTDTVKAILTPGEFVIRKEAVDMIGVPKLEKLNDMPEAGGHSEIDRLIAQATLKNMTGMYGGGMVNAKQYGHGGMVNKYEDGGQAMSNLKPVPDNNPGLAKLPEDVRNKMGYMQEGGLMEMMHGGKAKKKKEVYGYQDGGQAYSQILYNTPLENSFAQELEPGLFDVGSILSISADQVGGEGDRRYYLGEGQSKMLNMARKKAAMRARQKMASAPQDSIPAALVESYFEQAPEEEKGGFLKKLLGMQEGGAVQDSIKRENEMQAVMDLAGAQFRYNQAMGIDNSVLPLSEQYPQDNAMMQQYLESLEQPQANPFVPFDQRPNQNPATGNWGESGDYMRSLRGELEMENKELVRDKAQNTLDRIRLDSLLKQAEQDKVDSLLKQGAMEIKSSPGDSFYFPNTPSQDNFMQKFKENMLNPTYFPEGS